MSVITKLNDGQDAYTVEDISGSEVSKYHYEINFNPKMWLPFVPVVKG